VKAGPWLFLTGHEAYDWRTGMVDEAVSGPPGYPLFGHHHKSRREADIIFNRMRRVLDEFGTDFAHSVRLDQYYPNPRAVAAYHLARHDAFGDYIPPSTSVVMERCFGGGSTISTSLIAVVPEAGYEINKIYPPGVASSPTSGFIPAVICNEFVFVAGQMAHNPGTGLDPRVIVPEHAAWAGIPIRQQTEFLIVEKLKPALEAAESSLERSVKAQIYLADIADMPDCLDVWSRHYAGIPCAITVVPTKILRDRRRDHRDQPDRAHERGDTPERGHRRQHPRHGCFRTIPQGRGIPAPLRIDGDRPRRPCRWKRGVPGLPRFGACRIQPG
jgi:enamine deaminase RidA (YjgF/YER057c/UK114 family)